MTKKATIALDFDGVINSYKSGFVAVDIIPDNPVLGSLEYIIELLDNGFNVAIYSTRNDYIHGRVAILNYLKHHGMKDEYLDKISITNGKPIAKIYIDDRGFQFRGTFPTIEYINNFTPWHGGKSSSEK